MNDTHIQQQLAHLSIAPPPQLWAQVELCLEQDAVCQLAGNWELPAPAAAWEQIAAELSGVPAAGAAWEPLQEIAVAAPEDVWPQLQLQLQQAEVAQTLSSTAVPPPAGSWDTIAQSLPSAPARVVAMRRFIQVAAAAAVTGILLFTGYRYLNNTAHNNEVVITAPLQEAPAPGTEEPANQPAAAATITIAANTTPLVHTSAIAAAAANIVKTSNLPIKKEALHRAVASVTRTAEFEETRYMLVLDASGELVRVSPKLGQLPCAPNEAGVADAVAALDSPACKEWLKSLQQRMALTASVDAFGGGVDFYQVLKVTE